MREPPEIRAVAFTIYHREESGKRGEKNPEFESGIRPRHSGTILHSDGTTWSLAGAAAINRED